MDATRAREILLNGVDDALLIDVGDWLLDLEAERQELRAAQAPKPGPAWNRDTGELTIDGTLATRIKNIGIAVNVVRILDEFAELGWPVRIGDPLPRLASDSERNTRLRETVKSLNDGIGGMRFRHDGTTNGIVWEKI
jgi:hypothetical protein